MKNQIYLDGLFDYYGILLTEKQQEYFKDYHFNNYTLAEISENRKVSRNAVFKQLKEAENKLIVYENKLELYKKSMEIKKLIIFLNEDLKNKIEELI